MLLKFGNGNIRRGCYSYHIMVETITWQG